MTSTRSGADRARAVGVVGVVSGVLFAVLTVLTAWSGDWLERIFGLSPDGGSGETEWWLILSTAALSVASWIVAAMGLRRAKARPSTLEAPGHSSTGAPL